jgi:hypothetical protein
MLERTKRSAKRWTKYRSRLLYRPRATVDSNVDHSSSNYQEVFSMPIVFSPEMASQILRRRKTLTIRPNCLIDLGTIRNLLVVGDRVTIENYWKSVLTHCLLSIEITCLRFADVHSLKLKDLDDEIAVKDGFKNLAELERFWKNKNGVWDENATVYSHRFRTVTTSEKYEFLPIKVNERTDETEGYSLFGYDYCLKPIFYNRVRFQYHPNSDVTMELLDAVRNKTVLSLTVRGERIVEAKPSPVTTTDIFE